MKSIMNRVIHKLQKEDANSLVESVIVLPMIFLVIYFMILTAFIMHDRSTLDAAAKRGTIFAAKCVSDPNYSQILAKSGNDSGTLDTSLDTLNDDSFIGVGSNIKPYRYLKLDSNEIRNATQTEVYNVIQKTKIPWRDIVQAGDITVKVDNKIIYQNISVSIAAHYPLPQIFANFGLPEDIEYSVTATTAVNDPDEFIRNVDLIIDTMVEIDHMTGDHIKTISDKIGDMASKLKNFLEVKS